jgi:hypothetical protein
MSIVSSIKKVSLLQKYDIVCLSDCFFVVVAGTAIASSLMDKQGRKSLLITSFSGMVMSIFTSHLFQLMKL